MRQLAWVGIGWFGLIVWTALGSRYLSSHLIPDASIVVMIFLALRRDPISIAWHAIALGYLVGRQALAPFGLHESMLLVVSIGAYVASGQLAGGGALFFAFIAGIAGATYHLLLFLVLIIVRGSAGFPTWASGLLLPNALATSVLALLCYPGMVKLEHRLEPERHESLSWR